MWRRSPPTSSAPQSALEASPRLWRRRRHGCSPSAHARSLVPAPFRGHRHVTRRRHRLRGPHAMTRRRRHQVQARHKLSRQPNFMISWMLLLSSVVNTCPLWCLLFFLARPGVKKRVAFGDPLATVRTYSDSIGGSADPVSTSRPSSGSSACARLCASVYGPDGVCLSIVPVHAVCVSSCLC